MAWWYRIDRYGDSHIVFSQEKDMSCGLASAKMIVFKVNKLRPGGSALVTEERIEKLYKKFVEPHADFAKHGSTVSGIVKVLNELGIGNWAAHTNVGPRIPGYLIKYLGADTVGLGPINSLVRGYPVMLWIQWPQYWDSKTASWKHAAHWVVVDTVTTIPFSDHYNAAVCDPWDGDLHMTRFHKHHTVHYNVGGYIVSANIIGDPEHHYKKKGHGQAIHILYCQKTPGFWS